MDDKNLNRLQKISELMGLLVYAVLFGSIVWVFVSKPMSSQPETCEASEVSATHCDDD